MCPFDSSHHVLPLDVAIYSRLCYTAKRQYRKFETDIPRKELRGLSPNFHFHVLAFLL
jgi:hypothetical protein